MQIYIANGTRLTHEFMYRIPNVKTPRMIKIPAGAQIMLPEDLKGQALKSVIDQLELIGGVESKEVHRIIKPRALIYSVSEAMKSDVVNESRKKDEEARQEVAGQMMEDAGFNAFEIAKREGHKVVETTVEIIEMTDDGAARGKGKVNFEAVVTTKPQRNAGRKRVERKTTR